MSRMTGLSILLVVGSLVLAGLPQSTSAAMIQIQLGGVDLLYDGTNVTDGNLGQPDPLSNATFFVDNTNVGAVTSGVTMDLYVPDVFNIAVGGGQVTSATDGDLDLDLGGGDFLYLTLDEAMVSYFPLTSTIQFVFAGSTAGIDGQQLPFDLTIGEPVSVSFSTQVTAGSVSESGGYVTGFTSADTGEIQGIPEPATMGLLGLGGLALIRRRRK